MHEGWFESSIRKNTERNLRISMASAAEFRLLSDN